MLSMQGHFGMSQTEELEAAIDNCKDLIHQAAPGSDRHRSLVRTLVTLRLKLQELKVCLTTHTVSLYPGNTCIYLLFMSLAFLVHN